MRVDAWLDIACLFRTRSEAQKACRSGKVDVNGQAAKPHRELKEGDEIVTGSYKTLRTLKTDTVVKVDNKEVGKDEKKL